MNAKPPRPESERAAAVRLTTALGISISRGTVRRLRAKGIDTADTAGVRHALAQQERRGAATGPPGPKLDTTGDPAEPLDEEQLNRRLAQLEAELLQAGDYEVARCVRVRISGFRELVRTQRDRGQLVDREKVTAEGFELGLLFRHAVQRIPSGLVPMLVGLDYPAAFLKAEDWCHDLLVELSNTSRSHTVEILSQYRQKS
jgi:hypothetical protein